MPLHHSRIWLLITVACSLALSLTATSAATADAKPLYSKYCAQCHGEDGRGDTPTGRAMKLSSIADTEEAVTVALVRKDPQHRSASEALDDAELAAIAAIVAGL